MPTLSEIFPEGRREDVIQTEWSREWGDYSIGFARAAELLVDDFRRGRVQAEIDAVGLAIVFLDRHAIELTLKRALSDLNGVFPTVHSLSELWTAFLQIVAEATGVGADALAKETGVVQALDDMDAGSASFRYPADVSGKAYAVPPFIDPVLLHRAVEQICGVVDGFLGEMEERRRG